MARSTFIKAASTSTSVSSSRSELEKMLRRYGASSFQVAQDFTTRRASVSFMLPNDPAHPSAQVPVRLYVRLSASRGCSTLAGAAPSTWRSWSAPSGSRGAT